MNKRIKELRKTLNLTQTEFGKKIGRSLKAVQYYENGQRGIDNSLTLLICQTFGVNETWLREGQGEIFKSNQELSQSKDSRDALITAALRHISDEEKDFILKYIEERELLKEAAREKRMNKKIG